MKQMLDLSNQEMWREENARFSLFIGTEISSFAFFFPFYVSWFRKLKFCPIFERKRLVVLFLLQILRH